MSARKGGEWSRSVIRWYGSVVWKFRGLQDDMGVEERDMWDALFSCGR